MEHFAAYLGIDWSDQKHDVCVVDLASGHKEKKVINHTPEALDSVGCLVEDALLRSAACRLPGTVAWPAHLCALEGVTFWCSTPLTQPRSLNIVKPFRLRGPQMIRRMLSIWSSC